MRSENGTGAVCYLDGRVEGGRHLAIIFNLLRTRFQVRCSLICGAARVYSRRRAICLVAPPPESGECSRLGAHASNQDTAHRSADDLRPKRASPGKRVGGKNGRGGCMHPSHCLLGRLRSVALAGWAGGRSCSHGDADYGECVRWVWVPWFVGSTAMLRLRRRRTAVYSSVANTISRGPWGADHTAPCRCLPALRLVYCTATPPIPSSPPGCCLPFAGHRTSAFMKATLDAQPLSCASAAPIGGGITEPYHTLTHPDPFVHSASQHATRWGTPQIFIPIPIPYMMYKPYCRAWHF
ncbi:hypothetical protein FKP32DRAFT_621410 [Trametes sanguinea]|nr:hypothetical protein FKP32DRAFT_621410 [Trametes sanguinea]